MDILNSVTSHQARSVHAFLQKTQAIHPSVTKLGDHNKIFTIPWHLVLSISSGDGPLFPSLSPSATSISAPHLVIIDGTSQDVDSGYLAQAHQLPPVACRTAFHRTAVVAHYNLRSQEFPGYHFIRHDELYPSLVLPRDGGALVLPPATILPRATISSASQLQCKSLRSDMPIVYLQWSYLSPS